MTSVEKRFLTGFRSADADTPGLIQEDDGTVWLIAPDGTRTQISGGGSSPAVVSLSTAILDYDGSRIPFDNIDRDPDGLWTPASSGFIIKTAGWYRAQFFSGLGAGAISVPASGANETNEIEISNSGAGYNVGGAISQHAEVAGGSYDAPPLSGVIHVGVGDRLAVDGEGGTGWVVRSGSVFSICLLTAT